MPVLQESFLRQDYLHVCAFTVFLCQRFFFFFFWSATAL